MSSAKFSTFPAAILIAIVPAFSFQDAATPKPEASSKVEPQSKEAIENIIREYILAHPEVMIQSVNMYQQKQRLEAQRKAAEGAKSHQEELANDASSPSVGKQGDVVTMVQFFDYHCGFCKREAPVVKKIMESRPNIRVVYKEFPILGEDSVLAAKAALAANRQGKYIPYHEELMKFSGTFTQAVLEELAAKHGMDVAKLKTDMQAPETSQTLQRNLQLAQAVGIESTPTFVIDGQLVVGAQSEATLLAAIDKAEAARKPAAKP